MTPAPLSRRRFLTLSALAGAACAAGVPILDAGLAPTASAATTTSLAPLGNHLGASPWGNDLDAIVWSEERGAWDVYHQRSASGQPMWNRVTSPDLLHFTQSGTALASSGTSDPASWREAWTGSVYVNDAGLVAGVPKGARVAFFSGLRRSDGSQNVWGAWSSDGGATFSHYLNDGRALLTNASSSNGKDFRDPCVFAWNGALLMYVAEGEAIGMYRSTDGLTWARPYTRYDGKLWSDVYGKGLSGLQAPVECPELRLLPTASGTRVLAVLMYGAKRLGLSDPETTGTYYVVGDLDDRGVFSPGSDARRLDAGTDFYASRVTQGGEGTYVMGWVGNWSWTNSGVHVAQDSSSAYYDQLGAYSSPRSLTLTEDGALLQTLVRPADVYPASSASGVRSYALTQVNGAATTCSWERDGEALASVYDIDASALTVQDASKAHLFIDVWQGASYVRSEIDLASGWAVTRQGAKELESARSGGATPAKAYGNWGGGWHYKPLGDARGAITLVTDRTSVELFYPGGSTYTAARFAAADATQDVKVYTEEGLSGSVKVTRSVVDPARAAADAKAAAQAAAVAANSVPVSNATGLGTITLTPVNAKASYEAGDTLSWTLTVATPVNRSAQGWAVSATNLRDGSWSAVRWPSVGAGGTRTSGVHRLDHVVTASDVARGWFQPAITVHAWAPGWSKDLGSVTISSEKTGDKGRVTL